MSSLSLSLSLSTLMALPFHCQFQIAIVVYCLYLKLGVSSLIGSLVTIIVMLPLQFIVGREMSRNSEHGAVSKALIIITFYNKNNDDNCMRKREKERERDEKKASSWNKKKPQNFIQLFFHYSVT